MSRTLGWTAAAVIAGAALGSAAFWAVVMFGPDLDWIGDL